MNSVDSTTLNNISTLGEGNFFSMNHPFFYFLSLLIIGLITYFFNIKQKRKENIYSAKKEVLKKRIDIYNELYNLTSLASQIIPVDGSDFGINIFRKVKILEDWSNNFSVFYSKNWMYFTKETKIAIQIVRKFQTTFLPKKNKFTDQDLLHFSSEFLNDWVFITDELRNSIEDYFNNKIDLKQKFIDLTDQDNRLVEKKCSNLQILKSLIIMK